MLRLVVSTVYHGWPGFSCTGDLHKIFGHRWPFRTDGRHIMYGVVAVLLVATSVALELLDFPPIYWIIDSHAIWHFATVPLPLLWYATII